MELSFPLASFEYHWFTIVLEAYQMSRLSVQSSAYLWCYFHFDLKTECARGDLKKRRIKKFNRSM